MTDNLQISIDNSTTQFIGRETLLVKLGRTIVHKILSSITQGSVSLTEGGQVTEFGAHDGMYAELRVVDKSFYSTIVINGAMGFAESYIAGLWDTQSIQDLMQVLTMNLAKVNNVRNPVSNILAAVFSSFSAIFKANTLWGAKRNISKHYDLNPDFFKLFLDETMSYSSAIFQDNTSLHEAQSYKLEHICQQLELKPTDHVLEIGGGWGSFAIYCATNYGVKVTTTTISEQQHNYCLTKVRELGLENKITVLRQDYRKLKGKYDKLVSIEMIEAVGAKYFSRYFKQCSKLLNDNGIFVLQAITVRDQYFESEAESVDFIKKHIFPGGCLPSVNSIMHNISHDTDLALEKLTNISQDYATTLHSWSERLAANKSRLIDFELDSQFYRKWQYYLAYCRAGFLAKRVFAWQFCFVK